MTIQHDSNLKCSTHLESGLAVRWIRDDPPMERRSFFALIVDGQEFPFEGFYDFGNDRTGQSKELSGTLSTERKTRFRRVSEKNFKASNITGDFDRQMFIEVWQNLVSQGFSSIKVSALYAEYDPSTPEQKKEWRATERQS